MLKSGMCIYMSDTTTPDSKPCPKCRGIGIRHSGHPKLGPYACRPCNGTGAYPDLNDILARLGDREKQAMLYDTRNPAANCRDGMVMTRLGLMGLTLCCRSGDNAEVLTDLGKDIQKLIIAEQAA